MRVVSKGVIWANDRVAFGVGTCHLIYVDGSHILGDAMCDLLLADQLLRPGGWLLTDDVANEDWPGVAEAWARLPDWYERHEGPPTWGVAVNRLRT